MGKIVLTQGSFDVFHYGHVNFLRRSARLGKLYVQVLTDESYEKNRGYKPQDSEDKRLANVRNCVWVQDAWLVKPEDMSLFISFYHPNFLTIGTDWVTKGIYKRWNVTPEQIDDKLVFIPYTQGISSTYVKEKIKKG